MRRSRSRSCTAGSARCSRTRPRASPRRRCTTCWRGSGRRCSAPDRWLPHALGAGGDDHDPARLGLRARGLRPRRRVGRSARGGQPGDVLLLAGGARLRAVDHVLRRGVPVLPARARAARRAQPRVVGRLLGARAAHPLLRRVPVRARGRDPRAPPRLAPGGARRSALVAVVGIALLPLAIDQRNSGKAKWIEESSLVSRIGGDAPSSSSSASTDPGRSAPPRSAGCSRSARSGSCCARAATRERDRARDAAIVAATGVGAAAGARRQRT